MPTALITGITGQDGSYLAELLLEKNYEVHGVIRRASSFNTGRIDHIFDRLHLHHGDVTDALCLMRVASEVRPDEVYNLAAQSHVAVSFDSPNYTANATAIGALNLLEAVRVYCPEARYYQASTSELFGNQPAPQNEVTPFSPRSPYACAKLFAHETTRVFRDAYGLHASCGILFNHESPRRGKTFVTQKICRAAARRERVRLGSLWSKRDWGNARDYVYAMWLMLQQRDPDDYVIATGETHTVVELAELAYAEVGLDWRQHVSVDEKYHRPLEVDCLLGDASKARRKLGWSPTTTFNELVSEMVNAARETT